MSRTTFIGLIFVFIFLSFMAFNSAMPETKNTEVMSLISPYMPYKIEKRLAGLTIVNTKTKEREKPSNDIIYKRLDELEKNWGKRYLKIQSSTLSILNDNNKTIKSFKLQNKKQTAFVHNFFGI